MVQTDDNTAELILEKLRRIENEISDHKKQNREGFESVQRRFNALDDRQSAVDKNISALYGLLTNLGGDVDALKHRLTRIEDRLDIVDEAPAH